MKIDSHKFFFEDLRIEANWNRRILQETGGCCECTTFHSGPNCNDECDETICSIDPYCCKTKWDFICANQAKAECNTDISGNENGDFNYYADSYYYDYDINATSSDINGACCNCKSPENGPGCSSNPSCEESICPYDTYCCETEWDDICANEAKKECGITPGNTDVNADVSCCDCVQTEYDPGCSENTKCENIICPLDSYCCDTAWDDVCVQGAVIICDASENWQIGGSDPYDPDNSATYGSCCDCTEENDEPGCNAVCDKEVCALDSYCCDTQWDSTCADGANNICDGSDYFYETLYGTYGYYPYGYGMYCYYYYGY